MPVTLHLTLLSASGRNWLKTPKTAQSAIKNKQNQNDNRKSNNNNNKKAQNKKHNKDLDQPEM